MLDEDGIDRLAVAELVDVDPDGDSEDRTHHHQAIESPSGLFLLTLGQAIKFERIVEFQQWRIFEGNRARQVEQMKRQEEQGKRQQRDDLSVCLHIDRRFV